MALFDNLLNRKKSDTESRYYSLDSLLKENATYNVVFGERSNGKTYAVLKHGLAEYVKHGGQLAYVRRWKEDIIGSRASDIWSALIDNGEISKITNDEYQGVYYTSGKFYLCNYDGEGKALYNDNDLLGFTFALSDTEHNKSISYPKVRTIIFDEFLTKGTYLRDEFVLFMNTVSTIIRQRTNVKIYMLGNTVNNYAPYFDEMGLNHIREQKQGTIEVYSYGDSKLTVAVEYTASTKSNKPNNFYYAFDNPKLNMITSGAWELDMYPHAPIKWKPSDIMFTYFIVYYENVFQCEIIAKDDITFTFIHEKTTPLQDPENDLIYTLDYIPKMNYNRSIYKPINKLQEKILWYFKSDRVYYQDNKVGNAITNYLKDCRLL